MPIYFLLFRTLQDIHGPKDEDHMNVDFVLLVWLPSRHEFNGTFNHGKRRNLSRKLSKLRVQRDSKFTPNSLWWRGAVHMSNRTVLIPSFINLYGCLYIYINIYIYIYIYTYIHMIFQCQLAPLSMVRCVKSQGIVDGFLEAVQFVVCCRTDPASYCRLGNLWDLIRSFLPILLLWQHQSRLLQCLIILIYWMLILYNHVCMYFFPPTLPQRLITIVGTGVFFNLELDVPRMRLLEGVSLSRQIGLALLPLKKLAHGLLPAMSFTVLGFCAFSHAMCAVQVTPEHLWPHTFWYSFTTLITQGLPEQPPDDYLELMLLYGGVLFFSIFVMNIFIGVISEQYASEKEQGDVMFERVRAHSCLNYLTRISLLPCNLLTSRAAALLAFGATALTLALQLWVLFYGSPMPGFWQLAALIVSQVVLFMASIQCKGKNYPWSEHDGGRRSGFRRCCHKYNARIRQTPWELARRLVTLATNAIPIFFTNIIKYL